MTTPTPDPVYVHSKKEAMLILIIWGLSFAWTVPYCYLTGYRTINELWDLKLVLGMPAWVFWGVAAPWTISGILSIIICLFFIKDDDLGQAEDELPLSEDHV